MTTLHPDITAELERAEDVVRGLEGTTLETISIASLDVRDAAFLGANISKLSPLISNLVERRVVAALEAAENPNGWRWVRQDPGFPDAALLDQHGQSLDAGYEVKAWYALSTEITSRFRESRDRLLGKDIRLLLVAWMMDHIVYGQPIVLGVIAVDAVSLAEARDHHYHDPPRYLIVEPEDTANRTANLQQSVVSGHRLQADNEHMAGSARMMVAGMGEADAIADPYSAETEQLVAKLLNTYAYRLDTNFAKIDRINHPGVEGFKEGVLASTFDNRTVAEWSQTLRRLSSDGDDAVAALDLIRTKIYGSES